MATLTEAGVLRPDVAGRYDPRDLHRVRLIGAFEASGVPLGALVAGAETGRIDFAGYHELHRDPGPPSDRSYGAFRTQVDPDGTRLHMLYTSFGLAEPDEATRLADAEEAFLTEWLAIVAAIGDGTHAVRVIRLFAEATRRASEAALEVYAEAASSLGPDPASVDLEAYADLLVPWTVAARALPDLAAWLTERHLRRAIDAFSVETTEQLLAAEGHVPIRRRRAGAWSSSSGMAPCSICRMPGRPC